MKIRLRFIGVIVPSPATLLGCLILSSLAAAIHAQEAAPSSSYPFEQGFPTREAARHARNDADFQRAVTAYRFWYPTISCEGIFNGLREVGIQDNESMVIMQSSPRQLMFTSNSDGPCAMATLDLKDGPYVIEVPPGKFVGVANDHNQGWILDLGLPGPAGSEGGRHLILPPNYQGEVPGNYFSGRSSSDKVLITLRSLPVDGDAKAAMESLRAVTIYPLATEDDPKLLKIVDISEQGLDATCLRWEDNLQFWNKLQQVIEAEPQTGKFQPMYGELAALGIEKGKPFAPDARMQRILEKAARSGRDQMLVSAFASNRPDRLAWRDRKWEWTGLTSGSAQFETEAAMDLEARDRWFTLATTTSPSMFRRSASTGSISWLADRDISGTPLNGSRTYRLTVPLPVPSDLSWSVTVYDSVIRSQVQTAQNNAVLRSLLELKDVGNAPSVDLYFGPDAPPEQKSRWIQTVPGRGWFASFRIDNPQDRAFDGSWKLGDFQAMGPEPIGELGTEEEVQEDEDQPD